MNLTFAGFLRSYCRELTGTQSDSLRKLCASVEDTCPAAAEAVMVFAASQGKGDYLARIAEDSWMGESYRSFLSELQHYPNLETYLQSSAAPQRYAKVWAAYQAKKGAIVADRRVIALMRQKTLDAMSAGKITTYRLCKELNLNLGNAYAYLSKGDVTKVSRATARRIWEKSMELAQHTV